MSEYVLELKGITKIFPGVKALNNVQFQLKPGEVHALMGENGAGKSTFIKVITGVHKAEEGEMFLNGQKVDFKGPKDAQAAGIAAVYQHPTSYPHLTVAENIFMGHEIIKNRMIQWKAMNTEANKLLKQLDADFDATAEMGTLSVAQQQMVEIAKAMSTNARIIILDEPTAGLDPQGRDDILDQIAALHKMRGITIILVSHSMEDIAKYVERLIVMNHGEMVFDDTPKNVFSHYKELEGMGLAAPQITYIMHALSENGLNVDTTATTVEEARDTILEALKKQKPSLLKKGGRSE